MHVNVNMVMVSHFKAGISTPGVPHALQSSPIYMSWNIGWTIL